MSDKVYKKLKKTNGERFAQVLRNYHNGLLEIENIEHIVRHAGRGEENATKLLPYLMHMMAANDEDYQPVAPKDPFMLLKQAGYDAFHADSLEAQNSIKHYYARGELLCTFDDNARYKNYHIVHAVKENVDEIKREDFKGVEERDDEYGTSVISIQMLKKGAFISIKNRYNHSVPNCDNTLNSNPDNIIEGLSEALKHHFNVDFKTQKYPLPAGFTLMNGQVFHYNEERNNFYYGHQAWAVNGAIHEVDRGKGDALFDRYLFDNQTKTLKKVDNNINDNFAKEFNKAYGGDRALHVKQGNLYLGDALLIGAEHSKIKTISLPRLKTIGTHCFFKMRYLERLDLAQLEKAGHNCFIGLPSLKVLNLPYLKGVEYSCFIGLKSLTHLSLNKLHNAGDFCFRRLPILQFLNLPNLNETGMLCFWDIPTLKFLNLSRLEKSEMADFKELKSLKRFYLKSPDMAPDDLKDVVRKPRGPRPRKMTRKPRPLKSV